jgi:hypothetical protein
LAQPTVFSQPIKLVPCTEFEALVAKYDGDARVRSLDCWTWFGALLFGQMTGHDSIRAIGRGFAHQDGEAVKLGFGPVRRSTLVDANRTRPLRVLEDLYAYCLARAQAAAPKKSGFRFSGQVFALYSTTIELCLSLSPWAVFRSAKGAVNLHTAVDVAGNLPRFAVITDGKHHALRTAREQIWFEPGATVVMDKAYIDYAWLYDLNQGGVWFVTRMKSNCQFIVLECREHDRTRGLRADHKLAPLTV